MTGTGNALATRNAPAPAQAGGAALAIRGNQSMWDDKQRAALVAMGVSSKATTAELAVFFHQCQKLGLDPFTKQIYLIHRRAKEDGQWVEKPTTQIGIDGFRVTRDRICAERGLSVEYEETIWFDSEGQGFEVWLWDEPPTACKFVVRVDGRRFPSVLRFNEYCQFGREDDAGNRPRTGRWRDGHAHQIEKCAEADSLRRAFPNDLSGVILEDMGPLDDPDAPAAERRQRVTPEQARARTAPQTVTATVVTPDASPAQPTPPPAAAATPPQQGAGEAPGRPAKPASDNQVGAIRGHFTRLGYADSDDDRVSRLSDTAKLAGRGGDLLSTRDLTGNEAAQAIRALARMATAQDLVELLQNGVVPGE